MKTKIINKRNILILLCLILAISFYEPSYKKEELSPLFRGISLPLNELITDSYLDGGSYFLKITDSKDQEMKLYFPVNIPSEVHVGTIDDSDPPLSKQTISDNDKRFIIYLLRKANHKSATYVLCKIRGRLKDYIQHAFAPEGPEPEFSID